MRLEITAAAEQELDDAVEWYRSQQAGLESRFLEEFRACLQRITAQPELYREIHAGIRRGLLNRFPYSLVYENDDEVLTILAVAHQHRKPYYWRDTAD